MTPTKSLSQRLRERLSVAESESRFGDAEDMREAAEALDAQAAEIALLKEGRTLHDELADHLEHELAAQSALLVQAAAALEKIEDWSRAYPVTVFLPPDLEKARKLLEAGGMTLDSISADAMRHVVDGVGDIAREALAAIRALTPENKTEDAKL